MVCRNEFRFGGAQVAAVVLVFEHLIEESTRHDSLARDFPGQ
jgi:hypothetical protein